jgi:7-keto-8-aminopelargonate synthetase-like enzyme
MTAGARSTTSPTAPGRTLIIAHGVFFMDGEVCCLPEQIALKKEFNWLPDDR